MKRVLVILAVLLLGGCMLCGLITAFPYLIDAFMGGFYEGLGTPAPSNQSSQPASQPRPQTSTRLLSASGTGDGITDNFTLAQGCGKVVIEWTGKALGTVPFVNFRFINADTGDSGGHSGVHELDQVSSGKDGLSLRAGTYYVEVDTNNASWTVKVTCGR